MKPVTGKDDLGGDTASPCSPVAAGPMAPFDLESIVFSWSPG